MHSITSPPHPDVSDAITSVTQLGELLSEPKPRLIDALRRVPGDIVILGAAGKMGPTLARMALRASRDDGAGGRRVIAVSRFSNTAEREKLNSHGVETIRCDLLDQAQLDALPDAPNVVYMAGMKFGSTGQESLTWAMNAYLPGMVCQKYRNSRIVAFSTGNVYGLSPVTNGGSVETDPPNPLGDYAMSCLGRERIFEHFSRTLNIPVSIIRLNYACEMRYGVLVDLAQRVWTDQPIDLAIGNINVIWQGDANAMSLAALEHAATPPFVLNVTGPELLSVRRVCEQLAARMGKAVTFSGTERPDALLNNGQLGHQRYGYPCVSVGQMLEWIARWVMRGGEGLGKPTHFEARDGKF